MDFMDITEGFKHERPKGQKARQTMEWLYGLDQLLLSVQHPDSSFIMMSLPTYSSVKSEPDPFTGPS